MTKNLLIPAALSTAMVAGLLAIAFASPVSVALSTTPTHIDAHPAWQRAGHDVTACCAVRAQDRAMPLLAGRLHPETDYDDATFMGGFYRDWGKWQKARENYERAQKLAHQQNKKLKEAVALNDAGLVNLSEALTVSAARKSELLEQARGLFDQADALADLRLKNVIATNRRAVQEETAFAAD